MPIIDPFEAQQPQRRGIVDPFEAQPVQSIVDPFAQPQAETKNPLIGALGRAASLTGSGIEAVAEAAERLGDKLELAVPLSGISEEDIKNKKQLQPMFDWAKSLKDFDKDLGYQPSTQLKELGSNPLNAIPFIAERVLTSSPDMVAAVGVFPAYVMARTKEILDERVKNDEKTLDEATVGDVTAAATAAVIESTLERFATKGLLKATPGATKTGRIAKETGIQAGTEVAEEEAAYLGEAAGTKKGLSAEEALLRGVEAGIVGGGLGATVQGVKEVVAPKAAIPGEIEEAALAPRTELAPRSEEERLSGAPDPDRIAELTELFRSQNVPYPEDAAREQATVDAKQEQEYALAQREAEGTAAVGEPVAEPTGVSDAMAVQPGAEPAPGGVGGLEPTGMVSAGPDVGQPDVGAGQAPAALTPESIAQITAAPAPAPLEQAIAEAQQLASAEEVATTPEGVITPESVQQALTPVAEEPAPEVVPVAGEATPEVVAEVAPEAAPAITEPAPTEEVVEELTPEAAKAVVEIDAEAKGKRGPKPLTPEAKAASDARRKQQRIDYNKTERMVGTIEAQLADAIAPVDLETVGTEEDLASAEASKRTAKVQAIQSLLDMQSKLKNTVLGARVSQILTDAKVTPKEIADAKAGLAYKKSQVSRSEKGTAVGKPEAGFSKVTNGAQALTQVIKTGTGFQKMVAQRLRGFVNNVNFVVLEKGDPIPEQLQRHMNDWNAARGLFIEDLPTKTRNVYVRGASFGVDQGVNNITVLHELLHAATNQKLSLGLIANASGFSADALLTRATRAFTRVMINASVAYEAMDAAGKVPADLRALVESTADVDEDGKPYFKIFELHQEFLAYGMTEPVMQKFLMTVDATQAKGSAFNRFVRAIMDFFNVDEQHFSAMTDLILITDKILTAQKTPEMRKLERVERGESYEQVFASAKQGREKVDKTVEKLQKSNFADDIRSDGLFDKLIGMRDENKFVDVMLNVTDGMRVQTMQQLLPALQTSTLVQWAERLGMTALRDAWNGINDMAAMRNRAFNAMVPVADKLNNLAAKSAEQYRALANVMHFSTIVSKDPNTVTTDKNLTVMWNRLTPENKKLYNEVREFYANNHKAYHALLDEQIAASDILGVASDTTSPKGKLIAQIKQMYEDGTKLYPYFPLMRYGQYWARVGKGKSREFQMFESQSDRDRFLRGRVKQLNESGEPRTLEQRIEDGDIDAGNDLSNARKQDVAASEMLKEIFNSIDAGKKGDEINAEKLKDDIYQMYLQTLPDRNFRRQFMHRQGVAGFSGDIHRNFVVTGTNMANQLARIKYGPEIMKDIERAGDSLVGNPSKAKFGEFVTEMRLRAEEQVRPNPEDGILFDLAKIANTSAFLWMMTSVKTMVAQLTAVPIFIAPVLASKHGLARTVAELTKSMNVFNGLGITKTNPDGSTSFTAPSMANLEGLTADEKLATQYMIDNGISDTTMAFDLGNRRNEPTKAGQSTTRRVLKTTSNVMTSLFHHAERMMREVAFMTSYRLNRAEGKSHEESLRAAVEESHEALGNYHASNRPRGIAANKKGEVTIGGSSPGGRVLLQFKMFPAFVTTYFIRNIYRATAGMNAKEKKEARIQLVGTLGMSFMLAGYVGIPGISLVMGLIGAALKGMREEDEDDPLEGRDFEFWFRNIWLPSTFGNVKVGGHTLDELMDKGLVAGLTGYDITGSMSMNNMWFPEMKDKATAVAEMQDYVISMLGPSVSLLQQIPKAVDYYGQGKMLQMSEQLLPALFRAPLTAYRYSKEGALTTSGAAIKEADEFTLGNLLAQGAGFATEGLQARREAIFKAQGMVLEIKRERAKTLARLDLEINQGSDEGVEKAMENIIKFNAKNYFDPISSEQITQSIKKRMERRLLSDRGFPIDKKYFPQVIELLEPSGKKIEREAAK